MSWFDKIKVKTGIRKKITKPEVLWLECKGCGEQIYIAEIEKNLKVCPNCDHHSRLDARERITQLINPGTFVEHDQDLASSDPLKFKDKKRYRDRLRATQKKGLSGDALITGTGMLGEHRVEICIFEFNFMGGSMGSVVGEKITRGIERAQAHRNPLIIVSCSGGARMQEGILSLMQMAKTASALRNLSEHKVPYISILTDPTTGGVSASFAMLGDIILAEPGALIGFAGPRVIEQTIQQKLPEGFQKSEFLLEHGLIDRVVHRKELKKTLETLLSVLANLPVRKKAPV
ncbi:MAG: acetyl-CoA carboxylase, carboxyltransferase subunit beta [Nitrospinaceae bacterium]